MTAGCTQSRAIQGSAGGQGHTTLVQGARVESPQGTGSAEGEKAKATHQSVFCGGVGLAVWHGELRVSEMWPGQSRLEFDEAVITSSSPSVMTRRVGDE